MNTKVVKFGGSSLADSAQFVKVADIIKAEPERRFVVASAPGKRSSADIKVTDLLYRCYDEAAAGKDFTDTLTEIRKRFSEIIDELGIDFAIDDEIEIIRRRLSEKPERAYMASRGEYLNSNILAAYLGFDFIDAADVIMFDGSGHLDEAGTFEKLHEELEKHEYAVIPGFYGTGADGSIVTFSRGGSDVTGSLVARACGADIYENWTDVSGMLFTDPRIVSNPRTIDYISYKELRELSYMGASVMHEDAVFPVRKVGIPINIRNTNRPSDRGTMIVPELPEGHGKTVTGIAGRKGFVNVLVEKSLMNSEIGFGSRLLRIFADHGVSFEHCPTGIDTMSVVVNAAEFRPHQYEIISAIKQELGPDTIIIETGLAMVAVVGQGMIATKGIAARVFRAIADAGVNICLIDQGSSELNIIVGIDEADYEKTIRSLAEEFG